VLVENTVAAMIIREKNCGKEKPLDIFQNSFSDEFKTVMSHFKNDLIKNSNEQEELKKIQDSQRSFEVGEPKDNRIKMVIFYSIEMFKIQSFKIPNKKAVCVAIFNHVYQDLIQNYPEGHPRSGVSKPPSKQYGYSESLKAACVLCAGVNNSFKL
jgi:hypothetical protein